MKDNFTIPDNIIQNDKARINLKVKEDTLLPGTSILEAQVSIFAPHEWKIKEINFTLNRREFNEFFFYSQSENDERYMAGFHQNYVVWKDTKPGKVFSNESIIEFKYPIPVNNNTPASFMHVNQEHEFTAFIDYFVMVHVISGDMEQSLLMTLPIRMLSFTLPKPGLSNMKTFELTYCGCMSDGTVDERLSVADPNLSYSKLNISAEYSINNSKSQLNISSITFSLIDIVHVIGVANFEGCCEGGHVPNFDENLLTLKTIVGIPKGGHTEGKIDLVIPPDILHSNDFGNSNGLTIKRAYIVRMTPVFDPPSSVDSSVSCLLNAGQVIQGITKYNELNLNSSSQNNMNPIINPNNQAFPLNFNASAIPDSYSYLKDQPKINQ